MLLRDYLRTEKQISRRLLTDIKFSGGAIFCNQQEVNVRYLLQEGDMITIVFPNEIKSGMMQSTEMDLSILYEDEALIVVDKPAGMPTIPSRLHPSHSLANGLLFYYETKRIPSTIHIVNRLDRDTTGLVLIAKHRFIHSILSEQQKNNELQRTYEAFVEGNVTKDNGTIDLPIARKESSIIERTVDPSGRRAITHFQVVKRYDDFTHMRFSLETGRTHQIRVHMQAVGHPLLGDELYGGKTTYMKRQALHSQGATLIHPLTQQKMTFVAPLPEDMQQMIKNR
ncbi:RluA family pseudouridine synthase [Massilibacterium senegalense]|uniref:RluA family pseudouridine synthase n=1 Tax=Massilibacterium senegalense TaxID=1632858 RepID=UPI00078533BA|nr:RluA family pseudouridine synthase [Massilibacterium senegalense]